MRQPGAPPACDMCGSTRDVGAVVHRAMVAHVPYVKDTCRTCSRKNAVRYYREGGAPIYARRGNEENTAPAASDTGTTPRPTSGGQDVGPTSREW